MVQIDDKKLSELESNALALQTIANRVLADVADIRKRQAASASKPKKQKRDQAYWDAKALELALTGRI
jgi:hypothetical protein